MIYTHVVNRDDIKVVSPLDRLMEKTGLQDEVESKVSIDEASAIEKLQPSSVQPERAEKDRASASDQSDDHDQSLESEIMSATNQSVTPGTVDKQEVDPATTSCVRKKLGKRSVGVWSVFRLLGKLFA